MANQLFNFLCAAVGILTNGANDFEAEGDGEAQTEDKVFVAMPDGSMVQMSVPDDTEGEDGNQEEEVMA